jgi:hypothetical protein
MASNQRETESVEVIFVKSFRHPKTGRRIRASEFGLKAFPLHVRRSNPRPEPLFEGMLGLQGDRDLSAD